MQETSTPPSVSNFWLLVLAAALTWAFHAKADTLAHIDIDVPTSAEKLYVTLGSPAVKIASDFATVGFETLQKNLSLLGGKVVINCKQLKHNDKISAHACWIQAQGADNDRQLRFDISEDKLVIRFSEEAARALYQDLHTQAYINEMKEYSKTVDLKLKKGRLEISCHLDAHQENDRCLISQTFD